MKVGDVVQMKSVKVYGGLQGMEIWDNFSPPEGQVFVFVCMGVQPADGSAPLDVNKVLDSMGWKLAKGDSDYDILHEDFEELEEKYDALVELYEAVCTELSKGQQRCAELTKQNRILELATLPEDELSGRIDNLLGRLAATQGWSSTEVARLLIEVQKRIAADWNEIGLLRIKAGGAAVKSHDNLLAASKAAVRAIDEHRLTRLEHAGLNEAQEQLRSAMGEGGAS